jgi:hypothetical protein
LVLGHEPGCSGQDLPILNAACAEAVQERCGKLDSSEFLIAERAFAAVLVPLLGLCEPAGSLLERFTWNRKGKP